MSLQLVRGRFKNVLDIPSDISTLNFNVQMIDNFIDDELVDTSITNAEVSGANRIIQYDNENIVPVGNNITIASTPNFTVAIGDIIRQGNVIAKITAVTSQTLVTVDDGSGLTASSATISQCVHTIDLNSFGDVAEKTRPIDVYTNNIDKILLSYFDDTAEATGTSANIAAQASVNSFTNSSGVVVKTEKFNEQQNALTFSPTGTALNIRFFANKTTGQGQIIMKGYKVSFHANV